MEDIVSKLPELKDIVVAILAILGAIVVLSTAIVRATPSKADDKYLDGFAVNFFKVMAWLPTIGINPQTKKLQEAYEELKAKDDDKTNS